MLSPARTYNQQTIHEVQEDGDVVGFIAYSERKQGWIAHDGPPGSGPFYLIAHRGRLCQASFPPDEAFPSRDAAAAAVTDWHRSRQPAAA